MNIAYVSALYNIYGKEDVSNILIKNVTFLIKSGINLIIYVDDFYEKILNDIGLSDKIKLINRPLCAFNIYNAIINSKNMLNLPSRRNQAKDTYEYIALMNTKIEFLLHAMNEVSPNISYIAWIDAGITKLFVNRDKCLSRLLKLQILNLDTVLFPGCYRRYIPFEQLCNDVYWIFLGTFFICNRSYISTFYHLSFSSIAKFFRKRCISWEVNTWIDILNENPQIFRWYYADHNDCLTNFPPEYTLQPIDIVN